MTYAVERLAQYVAELEYETIPVQTIASAKKCILDSTANMLCGRYTETGLRILKYLGAYPVESPLPKANLIDYGAQPLEQVILSHTVMARCADLDDGSRRAMGHPGCVLVPTALAVAQVYGKTGKELLTALVAGYDVYVRAGSSINPSSYRDRGFDATGLCGAIAAAGMIARLMDEEPQQIKDAMGLAALFCGGLIEYQNDGTMGKTLCGAWAALTGLRAARLAQVGFTGPVAAFEGKKAFMQAFSNAPNSEFLLKDLGSYFCIDEVYFKQHACMRGLHAAIDATLQLRKRMALQPETVKKVMVKTTPFVQRLSNPKPETAVGAQCSLQFTMAAALKYGHLTEESLLTAGLHDREILDLAQRIDCVFSEDIQSYVDAHPSHWSAVCVEVEKTDGAMEDATVYLPLGEPENPLSWEQLIEKMACITKNNQPVVPIQQIVSKIQDMESLQSVDLFR